MNFLPQLSEILDPKSREEFDVSPADIIRSYFEKLTPLDRSVRGISDEWQRLIRKSSADETGFTDTGGPQTSIEHEQTGLDLQQLYAWWDWDQTAQTLYHLMGVGYTGTVIGLEDETSQSVNEPSLPLDGSFSPSKKLAQMWIDNIKMLANDAGIPSTQIALPSNMVEAQQEFAKSLISFFGMIGQKLRYSGRTDRTVTREGRFTSSYEIQLCDRFFILPSASADFLSQLRSELTSALASGTVIRGAWGQLKLDRQSEVYFVLTPPRILADPSFVQSEEIE